MPNSPKPASACVTGSDASSAGQPPGARRVAGRQSLPALLRQAGRFALSGGLATGVHLGIMAAAVHAGLPGLAATVLGAAFGALANYVLQYTYTFNARISHARAIRRYSLTAAAAMLMNALMFYALHDGVRLPVATAQALTTGGLAMTHFLLYRKVVFHE